MQRLGAREGVEQGLAGAGDERVVDAARRAEQAAEQDLGELPRSRAAEDAVLDEPHHRKGRDGDGDVRGEFGGVRGRGGEEAADAFGDRQFPLATYRGGRPGRAGGQRRDGGRLRFRAGDQPGPRAEPARRDLQDGHRHTGPGGAVVRGEAQVGVRRAGARKVGEARCGGGGGAPPEPLGEGLDDGGRPRLGPAADGVGGAPVPPVRAGAVAEDEHGLAAGGVQQRARVPGRGFG